MKKSHTIVILLIAGLFFLTDCKKKDFPVEAIGIVKNVRYACGPSCDASVFSLLIDSNYYVPNQMLNTTYRIQNLNVIVRYRRTGEYPVQWSGPENMEKIEIISIRKR